jgi:hypothetical protein
MNQGAQLEGHGDIGDFESMVQSDTRREALINRTMDRRDYRLVLIAGNFDGRKNDYSIPTPDCPLSC